MSAGQVFLRAVPANIMICLSIQMGISARDMLGMFTLTPALSSVFSLSVLDSLPRRRLHLCLVYFHCDRSLFHLPVGDRHV